MSESRNEHRPELSRVSRIRLALSEAAAELADRATGLARTGVDGRPGDVAEESRSLVATAEYVLQLAVLYDRCRGASWATIGESLGEVSRQAAHERYAEADKYVDEAITEHWLTGDPRVIGLPSGAEASPRTVVRLDEWAATQHQHGDVGVGDDPARAVSAGLAPMTSTEHGVMLTAAATLLLKHATGNPVRRHALQVGYARRKVEWYERLIADELAEPGSTGTALTDLREGLAGARARLAEAEAETPHPGHPLTP
ncbi:hypothetical protein [Actinomadura sp. 9N215]|uniref:hypothetical protein n=1 Tax=Actinomadura sp. 9N215 TaxID=3375150 RepID=UPI0037996334